MAPRFISDDEMTQLEQGGQVKTFLSDAEMAELENQASGGDTMMGNVKAFASGLPKGAIDTANLIGGLNYYNPFSPSTFMNDRLYDSAQSEADSMKGALYQPQDSSERVLGTMGEFIGGDLVTLGLGKFFKGLQYGKGAATRGVDALTDAFTRAPARQLAASGAAGAAAGGAKEAGGGEVAQLAAALLAGQVPDMVTGLASGAYKMTKPGFQSNVNQKAGESLRAITDESFGPTLEQALAQQSDDALRGYKSTAELTGDVGVAQLEKELAATGPRGTRYAARAADRAQSRDELLDALSPSGPVDVEELTDSLRDKATQTSKAMRKSEENIWKKFPREQPIGVGPFRDEIASLVQERRGFGTNRLHSKLKKPITDLISGTDPAIGDDVENVLSSGALQDIRSDLMAQMREANLTPQDREVATAVINGIEEIFDNQLTPRNKAVWDAARGATRDRAETFAQRTSGGKLLDERIGEANVLDKVVRGSRRSVQELKKAIRKDSDLMNDVRRAIIDDPRLRDADGQLTPAKVKRFLDQKNNGLKELFGDQHYKQIQQVADDLKSEASVQKLASFASKGQSATAQKMKTSQYLKSMFTGNIPGGGLAEEVVSAIRQRHGNKLQEAVNEALFEAALDPKVAAELIKQPSPERLTKLQRLLIPILLSEATRDE